MPNRLAAASSLYLREHADNPVDWYEWGDEALARAKAEDKPLFVSVGYSACHWCHVMAHESFSDPEVGAALSASFISVKVDREERPDVDDVLMSAVQMANGHGGWPMTVFLTPDLEPFFTGTYFPGQSRDGMPSFLNVVNNLAQAWREQRTEVVRAAAEFASAVRQAGSRAMSASRTSLGVDLLDDAVAALWANFDRDFGGFGDAPKFPPHTAVTFLLDYAAMRHNLGEKDDLISKASTMAVATLLAMCRGGLHDHVGGGFHRYSTDREWLLPHFEKMLSDNALMAGNLARVVDILDEGEARDELSASLEGVLGWIRREMTAPDGTLYSAQDADSPGGEGAYYVWRYGEVAEALGDGAEAFCQTFSVQPEGNYLDEATGHPTGANVLYRSDTTPHSSELETLRAARENRPKPQTDTKRLLAWNALAVGALVSAGHIEQAEHIATQWLKQSGPALPHQLVDNGPQGIGFLDDHAYIADALLDLYEATEDGKWLAEAEGVVDQALALFSDPGGGFWSSSADHQTPITKLKPILDTACPSATAVMLRILRRLGRTSEFSRHFTQVAGWAERAPTACESLLREHLYALLQGAGEQAVVDFSRPGEALVFLTDYEITADATGFGHTTIVIDLPEGHHINSHEPPAKWLSPTTVQVKGALGEVGFPDDPSGVYQGRVELPVRLFAASGRHEFFLSVSYQLCDESKCLAPVTKELEGLLIVPPGQPQ
ncbi:MAG: DUF255 domain-containing protein [Fimbriimonadaceae bacterium]|nr:DUF255 domain-containing protein [Fimbriimonadaceae bacterium]